MMSRTLLIRRPATAAARAVGGVRAFTALRAPVNGRVKEHVAGCVCGGCVKVPSAVGSIGMRTAMSTSSSNDTYEVSAATRAKRPTSPHLTIYKLPVGAISSITNRVTGCILAGGMSVMSVIALTSTCDIPFWVEQFQLNHTTLFPIIKAGVAFPVVYHTAGGIRHLIWDTKATNLDLEWVEKSSKYILGGSVLVSVALAMYKYD